jgi:hypothetical protein
MIFALQYYEGDLEQTMTLARLIADNEPRYRKDVTFSLVCPPRTPVDALTRATIEYCGLKFAVEHVVSPLGAKEHPEGGTALFAGTAMHYHELWRSGELKQDAICMLDGGDGVPLHSDWISIMIREHERTTLKNKKLITGTPYFHETCPLHVNPNAIFEFSIFDKTDIVRDVPRYDGTLATHFNIYHRQAMLENASLSSIIHTDWRDGGEKASLKLLLDRSRHSVWLHGFKDTNLHWLCREHLLANDKTPEIMSYSLESRWSSCWFKNRLKPIEDTQP